MAATKLASASTVSGSSSRKGHSMEMYRERERYADSFQWTHSITSSLPQDILGNYNVTQQESLNWAAHYGEAKTQPNAPRSSTLLPDLVGSGVGHTQHIKSEIEEENTPQASVRTQVFTQPKTWIRWPLHLPGISVNGRLPCEAPLEVILKAMEGSATQPSTQPFADPRRDGTTSMINEDDEADVLCLLLPSSGPALRAVDLIAESSPQHILQNKHMEGIPEVEEELSYDTENMMTTKTEEALDVGDLGDTQMGPPPQPVASAPNGRPSRDIALRMSSRVHNPCLGFTFGRNALKCDLLLSNDEVMKLSNCHFRIFLNRNGVLMLEDTSTNGTFVDKVLLTSQRANNRVGNPESTRTLNQGAIIELPTITRQTEETIRFIVRFPNRDHQQEEYRLRLGAYLGYIQQAERQMQVTARKRTDMPTPVLLPFNPMKDQAEASPNASMLAAATGDNNHGLGWNGGDKYNVIKPIGKGAFAMVYQFSAKKDGEVYACKQIEKRRFIKDGVLNHKVHNEIKVMKDLEHSNIVQYIEYHETKAHIFIIMEFVHFGDLSTYTDAGTVMPEYMCQLMAFQILNALEYLHSKKITHRDIKPDNILVASHNPYTFKLSDFGLSKIVKNKETFLKSFCGTLLYCAPEIYPGFQRAKMGLHPSKRTRSWEPRKGTLPYEHSVDTWSLAAVLFHLLCGHAPYTGSMEDEGALMLMNIMKINPNWEYLEHAGISLLGRDFVRRSLVIDPQERARESQLLQHAWVTGKNASSQDLLQVTAGDYADGLDASQLSIAEQDPPNGYEKAEDDIEDPRESKRSKYHQQPESDGPLDLFGGPNRADWYGVSAHQWNDSQTASIVGHQQDQSVQGIPGNRLFGEIGSSALRSSGALGNNLHAALGMSEGSYATSDDDSFMQPELAGAEGVSFIPPNATRENFSNADNATTHGALQYPQLLPSGPYAGPAPSLYGAEALVDQLNMESPRSSISGPSADSKPTTPKTPGSYDASSSQANADHPTASTKTPSNQVTPKQATAGRSQHEAALYRSSDQPQDGQHDTQTKSDDQYDFGTTNTDEQYHGSEHRSGLDSEDHSDAQRLYPSLPSTAHNSQESAEGGPAPQLAGPSEDSQPDQSAHLAPGLPPPSRPMAGSMTSNKAEPPDVFAKPLPRFGVLRLVTGSIASEQIRLEQRYTSFGRDPAATVVHSNSTDDRIPKMALDILFWYPSIEKDIAKGKKTWHQNPKLTATISTRTNRYIKVNGIILMKGKDSRLFGNLYNGDIVEVFGPPRHHEYLQYRCEFFVGRSRQPRKATNPFKVEEMKREEDGSKPQGMIASKAPNVASSRAGSVASSTTKGSSAPMPAISSTIKDAAEKSSA